MRTRSVSSACMLATRSAVSAVTSQVSSIRLAVEAMRAEPSAGESKTEACRSGAVAALVVVVWDAVSARRG